MICFPRFSRASGWSASRTTSSQHLQSQNIRPWRVTRSPAGSWQRVHLILRHHPQVRGAPRRSPSQTCVRSCQNQSCSAPRTRHQPRVAHRSPSRNSALDPDSKFKQRWYAGPAPRHLGVLHIPSAARQTPRENFSRCDTITVANHAAMLLTYCTALLRHSQGVCTAADCSQDVYQVYCGRKRLITLQHALHVA